MRIMRALVIVALVAMMALVAGCERKIVNEIANNDQSLNGCFACHGETSFDGALLQARGEWENSLHASGTSVDYTNADRPNSDCQQCHNHQGFVNWIGTGEADTLVQSTVSSIHCFTCHAPHERGDLSLRISEAFTLMNGVVFDHGSANLCVNCHHSRTAMTADIGAGPTKTVNSRFGPHHGPQGDMLQGTHAFLFGGAAYPSSTHATSVQDGCIGCHMGNPQVHDGYNVGGHSFNMEYEAHDGTIYTLVKVCKDCHGSYSASGVTKFDDWKLKDLNGDGVVNGIQTEFDALRDSLGTLLVIRGVATRSSSGAFTIKTIEVPIDVAGAVYNFMTYQEDRSRGIHNPLFIEAMLKRAIEYLNNNPAPVANGDIASSRD